MNRGKNVSRTIALPALNMTPMIDVVFQLLIFFMCTVHFRVREGKLQTFLPNKGLDDPDIRERRVLYPEIRVQISYDEDRGAVQLMFDGSIYRDHETLGKALAAKRDECLKRLNYAPPVVIEAQRNVPYGEVVRVIDLCVRHGMEAEFALPRVVRAVNSSAGLR